MHETEKQKKETDKKPAPQTSENPCCPNYQQHSEQQQHRPEKDFIFLRVLSGYCIRKQHQGDGKTSLTNPQQRQRQRSV